MSFKFSDHVISIEEATSPHGWKDETGQVSRTLERARREREIRKPVFSVALILSLVYGGNLFKTVECILDTVRGSCESLVQWAPW